MTLVYKKLSVFQFWWKKYQIKLAKSITSYIERYNNIKIIRWDIIQLIADDVKCKGVSLDTITKVLFVKMCLLNIMMKLI